jgi:hypothetical protein
LTTTEIWLVVFGLIVIVYIGYDIFATIKWGIQATFSSLIYTQSLLHPLIPFAIGMVFGGLGIHLFSR